MCVPIEQYWNHSERSCRNERLKSLKLAALARMSPTYAGAWRVLVLDSDLQRTFRADTLPVVEIASKIVRSAWMGRCWTFQESSLAQNLVFALADGFIHSFELTYRLDQMFYRAIKRTGTVKDFDLLVGNLSNAVKHRPVGRISKTIFEDIGMDVQLRDFQLINVWNGLLGKSTTKGDDTRSILANLLDFNAGALRNIPIQHRMKAMLCAQDRLPLWLLFMDTPRLLAKKIPKPFSSKDLDRWVPRYPGGLNFPLGQLTKGYVRVRADEGLFLDSCAPIVNFQLRAGRHRHTRFCFHDITDPTDCRRYWIELHCCGYKHSAPSFAPQNFLILDQAAFGNRAFSQRGFLGLGAIFSGSVFSKSSIVATYDSSISFGKWESVESNCLFENSPVVFGKRLLGNREVIVKSGMYSENATKNELINFRYLQRVPNARSETHRLGDPSKRACDNRLGS